MTSLSTAIIGNAVGVLLALVVTITPAEGADSDWSVDLSGQYRVRVEDYEEPSVGLSSTDEFTSIAHRLLGGVSLDYKDHYRVFAQFGTFIENGRKPSARPTDEGHPDIQQLYLDFPLSPNNSARRLRFGRQEMSFGASRLVSLRDSPNIRRSFDALKLTFPWRSMEIQAFVGRPVELLRGAIDDSTDTSVAFWGVYGSAPLPNDTGLDFYYFGLDRDMSTFDQGVAAETRHTVGARIFGRHSAWNWDGEAAFQFGKFGDGSIRAWFIGGEVGRTWRDARWSPRLAIRSHVFSGDDDPLDPDLQTFNPLFPKTTFFTQAGLFSPANAIDLHPLLSAPSSGKLTYRAPVSGTPTSSGPSSERRACRALTCETQSCRVPTWSGRPFKGLISDKPTWRAPFLDSPIWRAPSSGRQTLKARISGKVFFRERTSRGRPYRGPI